MSLSLRQKQALFVRLVGKLIEHAYSLGFELTFGEAYRSPEEALRLSKLGVGIKNSNHTRRLAIDLNLFINGEYQAHGEAHRPLGEWWENQHDLCRSGIRFGDPNHYALEHEGVK